MLLTKLNYFLFDDYKIEKNLIRKWIWEIVFVRDE